MLLEDVPNLVIDSKLCELILEYDCFAMIYRGLK